MRTQISWLVAVVFASCCLLPPSLAHSSWLVIPNSSGANGTSNGTTACFDGVHEIPYSFLVTPQDANGSLRLRLGFPTTYSNLPGDAFVPPRSAKMGSLSASFNSSTCTITVFAGAQGGTAGVPLMSLRVGRHHGSGELHLSASIEQSPSSSSSMVDGDTPHVRWFGMGEREDGVVDLALGGNATNQWDFESCQNYLGSYSGGYLSFGGQVCAPVLFSAGRGGTGDGVAMVLNHPSYGKLNVSGDGRLVAWHSGALQHQLDVWVAHGSFPGRSMALSEALGHAQRFPEQLMGFWQSKNRYRSQKQVEEVLDGFLAHNISVDVVVLDAGSWAVQGDYNFSATCWPNPSAMTRHAALTNTLVMTSCWPMIDAGSWAYERFLRNRWVLTDGDGPADWKQHWGHTSGAPQHSITLLYDPSIAEAREALWTRLKQCYWDNGVRLFWLDADEPQRHGPLPKSINMSVGSMHQYGLAWVTYHQRTFFEGSRATDPSSPVAILTRSGYLGSGTLGTVLWNGDTFSSFATLRTTILAGLQAQLSGFYWWTCDLAGYEYGVIHGNELWTELYIRWLQYSTFLPVMRNHGKRMPYLPSNQCKDTHGYNEPWHFGDMALNITKRMVLLRDHLKPYIRETHDETTRVGLPFNRYLFYSFPMDEALWRWVDQRDADVETQFMFGGRYMVAPVVKWGQTTRRVYFPTASNATLWKRAFSTSTPETYEGGSMHHVHVPLQECAVFQLVRA